MPASEVSIMCQKVVSNLGPSLMTVGVEAIDIGCIKAALSPQNSRIINALFPERNDGTVSFDEDGIPVANLDYRQAGDDTDIGAVVTTPSCVGTVAQSKKMRIPYIIDQYAELGFKLNNAAADQICAEYDEMERQFKNGVSARSFIGGRFKSSIEGNLVDRIRKILQAVDLAGATKLVAGIGHNELTGTHTAQPIALFNSNDAQKGLTTDFEFMLDNLAVANTMQGRPIIITDSLDVRNYFKKLGIACCSDAGLDYSQLVNQPYEVYYSKKITALLPGATANNIIVAYPESFVFLNVDKWRNMQLAAGGNRIANTTFGSFSIIEPSIRFGDVALMQEIGSPLMRFDLRIKETDCSGNNAAFALDFLPSLQYNFITAPANANGVTGIFHYTVAQPV